MPRIVLSDAALMEHGARENLDDLFLSLYRSVAENGVSEIVRKVFSSWESLGYSDWRNSSHPYCDAINNEIGNSPNDWIDDFSAMKDRLLAKLKVLGDEVGTLSDAKHHEVTSGSEGPRSLTKKQFSPNSNVGFIAAWSCSSRSSLRR